MANYDVKADPQPQNINTPPWKPVVSAMRTALATVNGGASYTTQRLNDMSKQDMISACRLHGLVVDGL